MEMTLGDAQSGGGLVESLVKRTAKIPGDWEKRARMLATGPVATALARQLAELKHQRAAASDHAGMWARPRGDEWYAWALRASTTTSHSPEEVHQMGLDALKELNA